MNHTRRIQIDRDGCNQEEFDRQYGKIQDDPDTCREGCHKFCTKPCNCSQTWFLEKLLGFLPFIQIMRTYRWKKWIGRDIISGLSIGVIHLPQGMGFAILTGVAPVFGLYSSFWPVLFYFLFGTSKHISIGTMAIISIVLTAPVERAAQRFLASQEGLGYLAANESLANNETLLTSLPMDDIKEQEQTVRANTAALVTLMAGLIQIGMGLMRLGFVTTFMPTPFVSGFTTGAAFHITTSQITGLLGLKIKRVDGLFKLPLTWYEIGNSIQNTNLATMTVGIICIIWLVIIKEIINNKCRKRMKIPIPAELIVVIVGTVCSYFLHLNEKYHISTVGYIPRGIPPPAIPPFDHARDFVVEAIIAGVLSFAISVSLANLFCEKYQYNVDPNQEFIAYGLSHSLSACFGCFAGAAAPPRCFVHDQTGGKTQVAGLVSCFLLLLVLLAIGNLFKDLPTAVLSAIIVVAILPLFKQFKDTKIYWAINGIDTCIWLVTWASVVFLNIDIGLGIGMLFSVVTVVCHAMSAKGFVMGLAGNSGLYVPGSKYTSARKIGKICVFKFETNLYFASIKNFKNQLFAATFDPQKAYAQVDLGGNNLAEKSVSGTQDVGDPDKTDTGHLHLTFSSGEAHTTCDNGHSLYANDKLDDHDHGPVKVIILDCSAFTYIDFMGVNMLKRLSDIYGKAGVTLVLAGCTNETRRKLKNAGVISNHNNKDEEGEKAASYIPLYPSVNDAFVSHASLNIACCASDDNNISVY